MENKAKYTKPELQEYGSVFRLTKGHLKTFGPGDGLVLIDINNPDDPGVPIDWAPSGFH